MSADLLIQNNISIPQWELVFTASRSGGPGGQHANKTSSRVTLTWSLRDTSALSPGQKTRLKKKLGPRLNADGTLQIHVETSRSQTRNKEIACERLKELLVEALKRPKYRVATKPTKGSKSRRLDAKKARGNIKKMRKAPPQD